MEKMKELELKILATDKEPEECKILAKWNEWNERIAMVIFRVHCFIQPLIFIGVSSLWTMTEMKKVWISIYIIMEMLMMKRSDGSRPS